MRVSTWVASHAGEAEQGEILFSSRAGCSPSGSAVNIVELPPPPAKAAGAADGRSTQHYWALKIIQSRARMILQLLRSAEII